MYLDTCDIIDDTSHSIHCSYEENTWYGTSVVFVVRNIHMCTPSKFPIDMLRYVLNGMHSNKPFTTFPVSTKHVCNIYTTPAQRLRRWANIVLK